LLPGAVDRGLISRIGVPHHTGGRLCFIGLILLQNIFGLVVK